ncbi:MAG: MMPL family transporter [Actinobacteria bacterium]|nr:MMPL family transporter [Actinomycetota bacterium]
MFERLGNFVNRQRKLLLVLSLLTVILSGAIGSQVFSRFDSGGYSDPKSESAKVWEYLDDTFDARDPSIVLVLNSSTKSVDDPEYVQSARELEATVAREPAVDKVLSYWSAGSLPTLRSNDGKSGFIFVYLKSTDFTTIDKTGGIFQEKYDGNFKGLRVYASGGAIFANSINGRIQDDLKVSEAISIPLTFILLLIVFGAMAASAMPLVIGITAILGTFLGLYLLTFVTDVSIFALNLTTGLGLGLGIDYALLIVNRFREELSKGKSNGEAIVTTMGTAGRTVFFSGITVVLTLISLTFFPLNFLKSMGYAGAIVVALAVVGALIPLPAILVTIGKKIDKGTIRKSALVTHDDGRWSQVARFVMRRPIPIVLVTLVILGLMIAPLSSAKFGQVDSRVLPKDDRAYIASQFIAKNFPGQESNPIEIIFPNGSNQSLEISTFSAQLATLDGIVRVGIPENKNGATRLIAIHSMPPRTPEAEDLIHRIRALNAPDGMLVGGIAADYADSQGGIAQMLPWVILWISITVLILLFIFTGSIILPIKAVFLNFASLAATMGVLSFIFIKGNFTFLVGEFTNTGTLDTSSVVLIAIVAFGLSMDYEVFLLSRIKEEHDSGHVNVDSVAFGLQRSARIITAAAFILAVVFAAFIISGVTSIKMLGFGIAFAILLDATLIRAILVPALMRLFGEWNWWAPKSLKRFHINH